VLTWGVCSYCVRKRSELEQTPARTCQAGGLLSVAALLLLLEPDFGAATVVVRQPACRPVRRRRPA